MSGDQRVAAASAPTESRKRQRPQPDTRFVTGEYRLARMSVVLALLLLAGTAVYLVAQERQQTWRSAHESVLNLALGLETSITGLLEESASSLRGISADVSGDPAMAEPGQAFAALRGAARFDAISSYLGLRTAEGRILAIDRSGEPVMSPGVLRTISQALEAHGTGLDLSYLIRLPGRDEWYLPVTLSFATSAGATEVAFALVPVRRLLASTDSLRVIPDSWVMLVTTDGRRLVGYTPGSGYILAPRDRASPQSLALAGGRRSGVFLSLPSKDGLVGFARSAALPLYVSASVPIASLRRQWLEEAAAPTAVLVIGVLALLVFAWQLRRALRRQAVYVAEQEYLAQHDTLTGLRNRDGFTRELGRAITAAPGDPLAVFLLDLNRFKEINDTLGHAAGDRVLAEIGERLRERFGGSNICVARLGGDELAVLAPGIEAPWALESLGSRLQDCLGRTTVHGGIELDLTASIGAAVYPHDARTPTELLRCADIAMYSAKEELTAFCRYHEVMDQFTPEMLALQGELGKALREGALSVAYQPKVRLADGGLVGLEALARWTHPTMGPIAPSRFVPLADSTELVHPFAQFMLRAACEQVIAWGRLGARVPISVNISANNLLDRGFVEKLHAILESLALEPSLLELEVTESAVMRHPETMLKRLEEIRALGVRLSIDDFGTGYASLAYLKRLPVHTLKIDRSFVTNLTEDAADQRIVHSSIQLAHGFGMTVVAEGVETADAARELHAYGCDFAQGYHFGSPQTAAEIEAQWLQPGSATSAESAVCAAPAA